MPLRKQRAEQRRSNVALNIVRLQMRFDADVELPRHLYTLAIRLLFPSPSAPPTGKKPICLDSDFKTVDSK